MLRESTSVTDALATDHASDRALISAASVSRRCDVNVFESAMPSMRASLPRITAAAYTGPASGPRPASSTPQMSRSGILPLQNGKHRVGGLLGGGLPQQV